MSEDMIRRVALALAVLCAGERSFARNVPVQDTADLSRAIEAAQAGDDIVLANGIYLISTKLHARRIGHAGGTDHSARGASERRAYTVCGANSF